MNTEIAEHINKAVDLVNGHLHLKQVVYSNGEHSTDIVIEIPGDMYEPLKELLFNIKPVM